MSEQILMRHFLNGISVNYEDHRAYPTPASKCSYTIGSFYAISHFYPFGFRVGHLNFFNYSQEMAQIFDKLSFTFIRVSQRGNLLAEVKSSRQPS